MRLRTFLTARAAALTTGLLTLNGSLAAQATTPHGPIAGISVNGSDVAGTVPINGLFKSGTTNFAGFTAGCSAGTVAGTVQRDHRATIASPC